MKIEAPKNLHCVLAGGDFLGQELERKARDLGWPLVRTFGMTEVGSQLATGGDLKEGLKLLPVHQVKTDDDQRLWVKTPTLFTLEFSWREKWDVRYAKDKLDSDGYYPLQDRVELRGDRIIPRGRMDGAVKISGRLVQLYELKDQLDTFTLNNDCWGLLELNLKSDARQGFELELIHSPNVDRRIVEEFLQLVMPLKVSVVKKEIQRNELGKVLLNRPVF
jgi:O-succinylbenzoic acid--CoA ligase